MTISPWFVQVVYAVGFTGPGLPSSTSWTVTLGSVGRTASSSNITFSEPNGTFAWTVTPIGGYNTTWKGYVTVAGGNVSVTVRFNQVTYPVVFSETGLPSGTSWSVKLGPDSNSSTAHSVGFAEPNGTYSWAISPISGYSTTWRGNVTVSESKATVAVSFQAVVYSLSFVEQGLASGTNWSVTVGLEEASSTTAEVVFTEPNGTYYWSVTRIAGYTTTWTGSTAIQGSSVTNDLTFQHITYTVDFNETGLPAGTTWSVSVGDTSYARGRYEPRRGRTERFVQLLNPSGPRFHNNVGGSFSVSGARVDIMVAFLPVLYLVSFSASGLLGGTEWSVSLDGTPATSTSALITFDVANGSYAYLVDGVPGFTATRSGVVVVAGANQSVTVTFQPFDSKVTFVASGLPEGTTWGVTLAGQTSSTFGPSLAFTEPNGTYSYAVLAVPGFATTWSGSVSVVGSAILIPVRFAPVTYAISFDGPGSLRGQHGRSRSGTRRPGVPATGLSLLEPNGTYRVRGISTRGLLYGLGWFHRSQRLVALGRRALHDRHVHPDVPGERTPRRDQLVSDHCALRLDAGPRTDDALVRWDRHNHLPRRERDVTCPGPTRPATPQSRGTWPWAARHRHRLWRRWCPRPGRAGFPSGKSQH